MLPIFYDKINFIQANDIKELTAINESFIQSLKSNLEFLLYDRSNLRAIRQIAMNVLNSHVATSTPLSTSQPNGQVPAAPVPPPSASFKPPKLVIDNGKGLSMTSIPGCPQSSTDTTSLDATTLPNLFSLSKPSH